MMQNNNNITPDLPEVRGLAAVKYSCISGLATVLGALPTSFLHAIARITGWMVWHFSSSRRKYAAKAVAKHLDCSWEDACKIAKASFAENFCSFIEIFKVHKFSPVDSIKEVITQKNFDTVLKENGPIVITIAHIGSWELMAGFMGDFKPERYKITVVRSQRDAVLDKFLKTARSSQGMTFIGHRQAAGFVSAGLKKHNAMVAFLVDHNSSQKEAVFLPFFNDVAAVNSGPAMLALRAKAVVVPTFLVRRKEGGHTLHVGTPLYTDTLKGTIAERVEEIAMYYTKACEDIIRLYPEQWFWMHKRWKTRNPSKEEK